MHGTHRYFLPARSLYLLVLEDRREDNPPVLVIINKSDDGKEALKLDEDGLQRNFLQIAGFSPYLLRGC